MDARQALRKLRPHRHAFVCCLRTGESNNLKDGIVNRYGVLSWGHLLNKRTNSLDDLAYAISLLEYLPGVLRSCLICFAVTLEIKIGARSPTRRASRSLISRSGRLSSALNLRIVPCPLQMPDISLRSIEPLIVIVLECMRRKGAETDEVRR